MTRCSPPNSLFAEPFYTHPCEELTEDHAKHVILHQYVGCVKIPSTWVVPANNSAVRLALPAVVDVLIGCCLWNPYYGYFLVTSFDKQGQTVTLERKPTTTTAAPGTTVPMCTKFIFTPNV